MISVLLSCNVFLDTAPGIWDRPFNWRTSLKNFLVLRASFSWTSRRRRWRVEHLLCRQEWRFTLYSLMESFVTFHLKYVEPRLQPLQDNFMCKTISTLLECFDQVLKFPHTCSPLCSIKQDRRDPRNHSGQQVDLVTYGSPFRHGQISLFRWTNLPN